MKLLKKALLYDIANMAYLIADTGNDASHSLHRVRDICQEGNIDRVSRVLGIAYSNLLDVLRPILISLPIDENRDHSKTPHDYLFLFRRDHCHGYRLTPEVKLKIKETTHEYMVCLVLADWLDVTFPEAADVWRFRFEQALESLQILVASVAEVSSASFKRKIFPF
ncbi:MAG: hypothetical protein J1D77_08665 [Muribaculaceae bacterium]|nr:hypothetical protein [Muribaculaceae bacterium]